ncbi:MAG: hypothetical protein P1T08_02100 [Acidimicrobiia bacterium]|nr:hypothetical protein [Acidimicrobiia bacterium]
MSAAVLSIVLAACGGTGAASSTTETDAAITTVAAPITVPTTTPTVATSTTLGAATTTTKAGPETFDSGVFAVPFSIIKPESTVLTRWQVSADSYWLKHLSGKNMWVTITTLGPSAVEEWRERDLPLTFSDEIGEIEIGGLPGTSVDFAVDGRGALPGVDNFQFEKGDVGRLYIVDVDGEVVTIIGLAGADLWPQFEQELEELISGITWE